MSENRSNTHHKILAVLCALVAVSQVACYNNYFISRAQLEKLEARVEQRSVVKVIVDGCDVAAQPAATGGLPGAVIAQYEGATSDSGDPAADAKPATDAKPAVDGIDPATGCATVGVNTASPLRVVTTDGKTHRVTPFNFAMTDSQLVSPDYDLLLSIKDVEGAEVETFSGWKTSLMIGGSIVAGAATFLALILTADEERGFGQQ